MTFRSMSNRPKPPVRAGQLKTLAECWEIFKARVIPEGTPADQVLRAELTFMAGAAFMWDQSLAIGEPTVTEDEGAAHLEAIQKELHAFTEKVGDRVLMNAFPTRGRAH